MAFGHHSYDDVLGGPGTFSTDSGARATRPTDSHARTRSLHDCSQRSGPSMPTPLVMGHDKFKTDRRSYTALLNPPIVACRAFTARATHQESRSFRSTPTLPTKDASKRRATRLRPLSGTRP